MSQSNVLLLRKEDKEEESKDLAEKEESNDVKSDESTNLLGNNAEKSQGMKCF